MEEPEATRRLESRQLQTIRCGATPFQNSDAMKESLRSYNETPPSASGLRWTG